MELVDTKDLKSLPFLGVPVNVVNNYRPDKNRKPTIEEIDEFKKLLFKHIEIISPKCNSYFDILTTFHPAFLLRHPAQKKSTLEDLLEFKRKLRCYYKTYI